MFTYAVCAIWLLCTVSSHNKNTLVRGLSQQFLHKALYSLYDHRPLRYDFGRFLDPSFLFDILYCYHTNKQYCLTHISFSSYELIVMLILRRLASAHTELVKFASATTGR